MRLPALIARWHRHSRGSESSFRATNAPGAHRIPKSSARVWNFCAGESARWRFKRCQKAWCHPNLGANEEFLRRTSKLSAPTHLGDIAQKAHVCGQNQNYPLRFWFENEGAAFLASSKTGASDENLKFILKHVCWLLIHFTTCKMPELFNSNKGKTLKFPQRC